MVISARGMMVRVVGRPAQRLVKYAVAITWSLFALCSLNYALLRICVSDMRWHERQRDQTRIVVGAGGFPLLPRLPCPRYVAIVVCSAVENSEQRAAIRDTWARDARARKSRAFFLVGRPDDTPSGKILQERVASESEQYGDVIQADFRDTYRNLTLKSVFLLKWTYMYCATSRFVMKADDDIFVNVRNLMLFLRTQGSRQRHTRPFLAGKIHLTNEPSRELGSKAYLPASVFASESLPQYVSGPSYVMSKDAVRPLFMGALETPFLYLEDVFVTGIVAHKVDVERVNSPCFSCCAKLDDVCKYTNTITAHSLSPAVMITVWRHARNANTKCQSSPGNTAFASCYVRD